MCLDDSYKFCEKKSNIKLVSSAKFKHYVLRTDIINGWSQAQGRIGVPELFLINPKKKKWKDKNIKISLKSRR